jgi:hypothetical protein
MGKKKGGKSKGFISKGIHSNVSRSLRNALRRDYMASAERIINQRLAFNRGKNVVATIENPNKHETNKRFIRVNAREVWVSHR